MAVLYKVFIIRKDRIASMAENSVKKGFQDFDRGTIENIAEYLSPEELYSDVIERVRRYHPSDDITLIEKGYEVAKRAHEGQKRKSGEPYIIHPLYVALILADLELDKETITAGLLHDVVEDTKYTTDDIEKCFGSEIRDLVVSESEDKMPHLPKAESWKLRKEAFLNHLKDASYEAKVICLADKLSNLKQTVVDLALRGPDIWNKFNMKDVSLQEWYYKSVLIALNDLNELPAYKELEECIKYVFKDRN